jgi:hypothetical protein
VAVQIGTAVLVIVSVQWLAYSLKCWTAWSVKLKEQCDNSVDSCTSVGVGWCNV